MIMNWSSAMHLVEIYIVGFEIEINGGRMDSDGIWKVAVSGCNV